MKQSRLFWFLALMLVISLSCNVPQPEDSGLGIVSVSVSPHIGSGAFEATVTGFVPGADISLLTCYVSSTDAADVPAFSKELNYANYPNTGKYQFTIKGKFPTSVPGTHSLVCKLENRVKNTDWSDEFVVVPAEVFSPTPSSTALPAAVPTTIPTFTPTKLTTLVLNGKFKFPESDSTCPNGKLIHNSVWAATGTLVLTVDYTSLQASVTLQGSGQGTGEMCDYSLVATESYPLDRVTLSGTFDPNTNALTITGDVTFPLHDSCQIIDETVNPPACIAGDQTIKSNITLNGSIDPANSTGQGKIQWTGSEDWGVWQVP